MRGQATRINALFLREYYQRRHSLPDLPKAATFEGGYTDIFVTGVERNVWHCDVASLYPSVMLRYDIFPANDKLGIFHGLLADLRKFRLAAKAEMRAAAPRSREYGRLNALQNVFKVMINAFYGYLGFSQGHFADYDAAAKVTETGRDLLKKMVAWLSEHGANVIEIDTDGIYFVPPAKATANMLQTGLGEVLPQGIDIEFDAKYQAMFSYKAKNYALLDEDGRLILKGGALKSRGLERFQRQYLERMIRLLLEGKPEEVGAMKTEFERSIRERAWDIHMLAKTDTFQDSLDQYSKKIGAGGATVPPPTSWRCAARRRTSPATRSSITSPARRRRSAPTKTPSWPANGATMPRRERGILRVEAGRVGQEVRGVHPEGRRQASETRAGGAVLMGKSIFSGCPAGVLYVMYHLNVDRFNVNSDN